MGSPELLSLRCAFDALVKLPAEEWRYCQAHTTVRDFARGEPLLRQGERVDWLGFLLGGLVRYHRVEDQREVTLGFDCEDRFTGAFDAYTSRQPARYSIQALEPSRLARFDRGFFDVLTTRHAVWRELSWRIAERQLVHKIDKELRIRTLSPQQRYADLVRSDSYLVHRVPQYHLASYLGIAPETLSRIRARMSSPTAAPPRS
jgi:CRP-like cAMP-binding protein